jgi:RNA polymerase sigma-70 factor (ECF subfamily)
MTESVDSESNTIRRARRGDGTAFAWLVETYQTAIYNLCYWILGDADEAEDAAQETFLRAFAHLQRYDPAHSFKTWLCSIAHHYCIDRLRRRRFTWLSLDAETAIDHPALQAPIPTPEEATIQREESQHVQALLDRLTPEYRSAVVMRYGYDLSYEEIAEAIGASVSAVKSRLHRAREAMARLDGEPVRIGFAPSGPTHTRPAFFEG